MDAVSHPLMYESRGGSHVRLEFADPTASPMVSPSMELKAARPPAAWHAATSSTPLASPMVKSAPGLSRATSWSGVLKQGDSSVGTEALRRTTSISGGVGNGHTRLQATFQAIKKMSAGLSSPRIDFGPSRHKEGAKTPGYFDVTTEKVPEEA